MQFVSAQSNADIYFYEVRDTFAEKQNQNHATLPEAKVERSQAANGKYLKIQYQKKRLDFDKKEEPKKRTHFTDKQKSVLDSMWEESKTKSR